MQKVDKFLKEKIFDHLPKELRTKYFDFEPRSYPDDKFCSDLLDEIKKSHENCDYYREHVCKQFDFDVPDSLTPDDLENIPYLPCQIFKESEDRFMNLLKVPSEDIVLYSLSSSTTGDPSIVPRTVEDFDQIQYNSIKMFTEFLLWKESKDAMNFNFSPNREFMAVMARIKLNNPEHKKLLGGRVRYFTMCMNKPKEYYGTVKYMIKVELLKTAWESMKGGEKKHSFKLDVAEMLKIIQEILQTGQHKKKKHDRIHFGGSTMLMYQMIAGLYKKNVQLNLKDRCHVSTGGGGWDGVKGEVKMPDPINKRQFIGMFQKCLNVELKDFTDIFAFTESPVLFASHWSEKRQDFIYHCPDYARIIVRDLDKLESVNEGEEGLLEVITPYGVNGVVNQAMLVDDLVELISKTKCPECGYEGAAFRILGRLENAQGKSCSSLINWKY